MVVALHINVFQTVFCGAVVVVADTVVVIVIVAVAVAVCYGW